MTKALLDTNIVLSGLLYRGPSFEILRLAEAKKIILCTTPELLEEFINVLHHKKFQTRLNFLNVPTETLVLKFLTLVTLVPLQHSIVLQPHEQARDPADNIVLTSALSAKVDVLVSGDEDILCIKNLRNIRILSPTNFLSALSTER